QKKLLQSQEHFEKASTEQGRLEERKLLAVRATDQARGEIDITFPWSTVFLDLRLEAADEYRAPEDLSGWRVFDALQRSFPHVPVCILTASQRAANAGRAYRSGATAYWIKGASTGREMLAAV